MIEVTSPSLIFSMLAKTTDALLNFQGSLMAQIRGGGIDLDAQRDGIEGFWKSYEQVLAKIRDFCLDMGDSSEIVNEMNLSLKNFLNQIEQTELIVERAQADQQLDRQQAELCRSLNINVNAETSEKSVLKQMQHGITNRLRLQVQQNHIENQRFLDSVEYVDAIFGALIAIKTKSPKNLEGEGVEKYRLLLEKVQTKLDLLVQKVGGIQKSEEKFIGDFSNVVENFIEDAEESGRGTLPEGTLSDQIFQERKNRTKLLFQQVAKSRSSLQQKQRQYNTVAPSTSNRSTPSLIKQKPEASAGR